MHKRPGTSVYVSELNRRAIIPINWDIRHLADIVRPTGGKEKTIPLPKGTRKIKRGYISIEPLIARLPVDYRRGDIKTIGVSEVENRVLQEQVNSSSDIPILICNNTLPSTDEILGKNNIQLIYMQYSLSIDNFPLESINDPTEYDLELLGIDIDSTNDLAYLLWKVVN